MKKLETANRSGLAAGYGIIHTVVLKDKNLDAYAKLVYTYLSSRQGLGSKYCFPSISTISKDLGISVTKTKESIKSLETNNWIHKQKRPHKNGNISNQYYVLFPAPEEIEEESIKHSKSDKSEPKRPQARKETLKILRSEGRSPDDQPKAKVGRDTTKGRSPDDQGWVARRPLTIPYNKTNKHITALDAKSPDKAEPNKNKLDFVIELLGDKYNYHNQKTIYISTVSDTEYEEILDQTKETGLKIKRSSK